MCSPKLFRKYALWQCFALEHLEVALSRGATLAHIAGTLSQGLFVGAAGMPSRDRPRQILEHHSAATLVAVTSHDKPSRA